MLTVQLKFTITETCTSVHKHTLKVVQYSDKKKAALVAFSYDTVILWTLPQHFQGMHSLCGMSVVRAKMSVYAVELSFVRIVVWAEDTVTNTNTVTRVSSHTTARYHTPEMPTTMLHTVSALQGCLTAARALFQLCSSSVPTCCITPTRRPAFACIANDVIITYFVCYLLRDL